MDTNTKQTGASVAIIVVVLIIALGGAYFWYTRTVEAPTTINIESVSNETLRNDLQASGDVQIDADLQDIESLFESN